MRVAVREAAEALDHVAVLLRIAELIFVAERGEQQHRAVLVVEILAVLERHVEEAALLRLELLVEARGRPRALAIAERQMIGRELLGVAAEHVARELVEQDHAGERGQRVVEEGIDRELALLGPQLEEVLLDPLVELGPAAPPLLSGRGRTRI